MTTPMPTKIPIAISSPDPPSGLVFAGRKSGLLGMIRSAPGGRRAESSQRREIRRRPRLRATPSPIATRQTPNPPGPVARPPTLQGSIPESPSSGDGLASAGRAAASRPAPPSAARTVAPKSTNESAAPTAVRRSARAGATRVNLRMGPGPATIGPQDDAQVAGADRGGLSES